MLTMRSLAVWCVCAFLNVAAVLAGPGDECFIIPVRVDPIKHGVSIIAGNFGNQQFWLNVKDISVKNGSKIEDECIAGGTLKTLTLVEVWDGTEHGVKPIKMSAFFENVQETSLKLTEQTEQSVDLKEGSSDALTQELVEDVSLLYLPNVHIQLSHPVYSPGDYLMYRVLLTDELNKALPGPLNVTVALRHETQDLVVSKDIQMRPSEIYSDQHLLAEDRDLGNWNLTVTVEGRTTTKSFLVMNYYTPLHDIKLTVKKLDVKNLVLNVSARYIFDMPIVGSLTLDLKGGDFPFSITTNTFNGNKIFTILMSNILNSTVAQSDQCLIDVLVTLNTTNGVTNRTYHHRRKIPIHRFTHTLTLHRMVGFSAGQNATLLVKLTRLDGQSFYGTQSISGKAELWDEDRKSIPDIKTFEQTLESDGTAVLSVPTSDSTTSVIFKVKFHSLKASMKLVPAYVPELFVRIIPVRDRSDPEHDLTDFRLGIASSHLLAGLIMVFRSIEGIVSHDIVIIENDHTSYQEYKPWTMLKSQQLRSVHLYAKSDDMLVQTSVSHVEPQPPKKTLIEFNDNDDGMHELKVIAPREGRAVVGVAVYEGLLEGINTDNINRYMMFNGSLLPDTMSDFRAAYSGYMYISRSDRLDSGERDQSDHLEKPGTKFNKLLLWELGTTSHQNQVVNFMLQIPKHINHLTMTAFSFDETSGLDVATAIDWNRNADTEIYLHVPHSARKLESITVDVYVVNKRDHKTDRKKIIFVKLLNTANEFTFSNNSGLIDAPYKIIPVLLEPSQVVRAEFIIRPRKLGSIILKAEAHTAIKAIAWAEATLYTVPESVKQTGLPIVRTLDINNSNVTFNDLRIPIPLTIDPGTEKISVLLRHEQNQMAVLSVDQLLDALLRADPFTMAMKASLTLDVLNMARATLPEVKDTATAMLKQSLAMIIELAKDDGEFKIQEEHMMPSSTCWDTVVAVQALMCGRRHQKSQPRLEQTISNALDWLKNRQSARGDFCDDELADRTLRVELAAHILLAFSNTEINSWQYVVVIEAARTFLQESVRMLTDPYDLALVGYAMQISEKVKISTDSSVRRTVDATLMELLGQKQHSPTNTQLWWNASNDRDLAATSYALLLLISKNLLHDAAPIVSWIKHQPYRRRTSLISPDSHIALQALIAYAEQTSFIIPKYRAVLKAKAGNRVIYSKNLYYKSTTHVLNLPPATRSVDFEISGTISGALEINYCYMENVATHASKFNVRVDRESSGNLDYIDWKFCVRFIPKTNLERTRMVTCEISFPSGYIAEEDNLEDLRELDGILPITTRNDETQLVVTFEEITMEGRCFNVTGFRNKLTSQLLPGVVRVFDISDPANAAFKYFEV